MNNVVVGEIECVKLVDLVVVLYLVCNWCVN